MSARTYSHAEVTDMVMNHIAEFDEVARQRDALREVADLADDELRALLAERNDLLAALQAAANDLASLASTLQQGSQPQIFADEACEAATKVYRAALAKVQS